jgi:hypothetical protein
MNLILPDENSVRYSLPYFAPFLAAPLEAPLPPITRHPLGHGVRVFDDLAIEIESVEWIPVKQYSLWFDPAHGLSHAGYPQSLNGLASLRMSTVPTATVSVRGFHRQTRRRAISLQEQGKPVEKESKRIILKGHCFNIATYTFSGQIKG